MGGNALSTVATCRLPSAQYHGVVDDVMTRTRAAFANSRSEPVRSYTAKEDFGDLDVLFESEVTLDAKSELLEFVQREFRPRETFPTLEHCRNGAHAARSVVSFDYALPAGDAFQVDFLLTPTVEFDFARNYYAWNDLGNLIGVVARPFGLKFGHAGLFYPLRDGTHQIDNLLVTRNFRAALSFLDFKPDWFEEGFATREEIFTFATSSTYSVPDNYRLENRSNKARVRDRKRATYAAFLDWLERRPQLPSFQHPAEQKDWLPLLFSAFPDFAARYQAAFARLEQEQALRQRFNGQRIGSLANVQGPALGALMQQLRTDFADANQFAEFFLVATDDDVRTRIAALTRKTRLAPG